MARKVECKPRHLRIAFLIEIDSCSHQTLNMIFADSYGRWGGRRSPIIPTNNQGIDENYISFLKSFDPDIIYCFVDLNNDQIAYIHETFCPFKLIKHISSPKVDFGFSSLSSISLIPYINQIFSLSTTPPKVIDSYSSECQSKFLFNNFGDMTSSFNTTATAVNHLDSFKPLMLVNESMSDDPHSQSFLKYREYRNSDLEIINDFLEGPDLVISLSMLSEFCSERLKIQGDNESFNLVIGDSIKDRILYWNFRHYFHDNSFSEIVDLIVSPSDITSQIRVEELCKLISQRYLRNKTIKIRSCSCSEETLNEYKLTLSSHLAEYSIDIDSFEHLDNLFLGETFSSERYINDITFPSNQTSGSKSFNYSGNNVKVFESEPFFLYKSPVSNEINRGVWILDLNIQKEFSYTKFSNVIHNWLFSRRLRVDRQFLPLHNSANNSYLNHIRINKEKTISIPTEINVFPITFGIPDSLTAVKSSLVYPFDWDDFDSTSYKNINYRNKFSSAELSDKGRNFLGVLKFFPNIGPLQGYLLNTFWIKIFSHLGASKVSFNEQSIRPLSKLIEGIDFSNNNISHYSSHIAKKCLKIVEQKSKDRLLIKWTEIEDIWNTTWNEYIETVPRLTVEKDLLDENSQMLKESLKHLCEKSILHQGYQWKCNYCLNKNWVALNRFNDLLNCDVCSYQNRPEVDLLDWNFKINEFVLKSIQFHGTYALVWCLIRLSERALKSFYFAPSIKMDNHDSTSKCEIDLISFVDGVFYLCEVKSSSRLNESDINKFISIANVIRPDIALLAIMKETGEIRGYDKINTIESKLDKGIKFELLTFSKEDILDCSVLYH